jgi:arsenite-transporting ATPase
MPRDHVFGALERLHADLTDVHALLTGADSSARLVLTPERVVLAEARRAFTTLSLYGYSVDGVVANRVFPAGHGDADQAAAAWQKGWVSAQAEVLAEVEQSFDPLPVWRVGYAAAEPVGADSLASVATELYAGSDPMARHSGPEPMAMRRRGDVVQLALPLPLASRDDVDLTRRGDDLVVTVGSYRRVIALPGSLRQASVTGARLAAGRLQVRFGEAG